MANSIKICKNTRKLILIHSNTLYKVSLTDEEFYCDEEPILYDTYEHILGILIIKKSKYLVYVKKSENINDSIYVIRDIRFARIPFQDTEEAEIEIAQQTKNFIENNNFYYTAHKIENDQFLWNMHMHKHFEEYKITSHPIDEDDFDDWSDIISPFPLVYLYCGFCSLRKFGDFTMTILSLISSTKIGPRFYCRGVDDNGDTSFLVKTDITLIHDKDQIYKKSVLRGSIPLFWYQDKNPLRSSTKYSREKEVTRKAFLKHFKMLENIYGDIFVINLLSTKESETELSLAYIELLEENKIPYFNFDINKYVNNFENLKTMFFAKLSVLNCKYTFRINCLDCMDRTNIAQYLVNEYYLTQSLSFQDKAFTTCLGKLYAANGNALSNFYCGADSLKSELTTKGKRSVGGFLDDIYINANRLISGQFNDKTKQLLINTILEKTTETITEDNDTENSCEGKQFYIFTWCINSMKFSEQVNVKINNTWNSSFVVICLQKINMSYKKLIFDKKQEERDKWTQYFDKQLRNLSYRLISQNFHRNIGTLLFVKEEMLDEITEIKPFKFRQKLLNGNISVITNFVYKTKTFTISNSILSIDKQIYKENSETIKHISDIQQTCDYSFLTGFFDTELHINQADYKLYENSLDYRKLYMHDFLASNMHIFKSYNEGEVKFLPTKNTTKNKPVAKYTSRIFYNKKIDNAIYLDIPYSATGCNPVYGVFTINK